ncbi:MAG: cbb3-type cytochrome c oxidase subunit 3 [Candidatus Competibacteraceae bacterium]
MFDWLLWFTDMGNSKIFALLLFFSTFCAILIYVFTGKQRTRRLESYKYIPFQDESTDLQPGDGQ